MPRSKSASAMPLTTAARWKMDEVSRSMARCSTAVSAMSPVTDRRRGSLAARRRRRRIHYRDLLDRLGGAVSSVERASPQQERGKPASEKSFAAGDHNLHAFSSLHLDSGQLSVLRALR